VARFIRQSGIIIYFLRQKYPAGKAAKGLRGHSGHGPNVPKLPFTNALPNSKFA